MKYLVTGITGFAGPHMANLLIKEGHEVFGLIRHSNGRQTDILDIVSPEDFEKITFVYGDLQSFRVLNGIFQKHKFDGVFHLAAQSHPPTSFNDPLGTFEANIMGSANVIQAIMDHQPDCKLMFCSTSEVYGNVGQDRRKIKSTDTILPANPYGASKAATDLYLQERFENKEDPGFYHARFFAYRSAPRTHLLHLVGRLPGGPHDQRRCQPQIAGGKSEVGAGGAGCARYRERLLSADAQGRVQRQDLQCLRR